jgi:hypothetical protein
MPNQGYKGAIMLGTTMAAYLNHWESRGIVNSLTEKRLLRAEFRAYEYGPSTSEIIDCSGLLHMGVADPEELIDAAQELLRGYAESKAAVPYLRLYFDDGVTDFLHATPGAVVKVANYKTGDVDPETNLVPVSFELRVSGGYMSHVAGVYDDDDVSFTHNVGAANDTIQKTGGTNFMGLGFLAGQEMVVEGSTSNDLTLTIKAGGVAADALTVEEDTLTTEIAGDNVRLISFPIL